MTVQRSLEKKPRVIKEREIGGAGRSRNMTVALNLISYKYLVDMDVSFALDYEL